MVTGIAGVLTVIGEHFWLVVIACIEVAVAFILLGTAYKRKKYRNDRSGGAQIEGVERDFLEACNDWRNEACIMVRREDLLPVYATDSFYDMLGLNLRMLQEDIRNIGLNMADPEDEKRLWKSMNSGMAKNRWKNRSNGIPENGCCLDFDGQRMVSMI